MEKDFKKAKKTFQKLKLDPSSAAFAEEILDKKLLLKLKKSKYATDKNFFNVVNLLDNNVIFDSIDKVNRTDYVEKREIDHSTLYSFNGPFQLFHADVGNLEFLGKNATFPQYVLILVDLFSSKVYTFPMRSRKQISQRLEQFYDQVESKRKGKEMKLQVDQESQQQKIKDVKKQNNVKMFSTSLRGGKAFAAEQKIRELKTRISKLKGQKLKITPNKIIEISTKNMNIQPSKKYGISPDEVESRALKSEKFRTLYNMHRIEKTGKLNIRMDRYDQKKYSKKRKKLREDLKIDERVYLLAERIRNKSGPGKIYKKTVQNISYFNKETIYTIRKKQLIDGIRYYWVRSPINDLPKRFLRTQIFALKSIFNLKKK